MTAPTLVTHEGVTLPLDTFIDAWRLVRIDPFAPPAMAGDTPLLTVDAAGIVRDGIPANQIALLNIVAFRPAGRWLDWEPCFFCGTSPDKDDICDDCLDSAGY